MFISGAFSMANRAKKINKNTFVCRFLFRKGLKGGSISQKMKMKTRKNKQKPRVDRVFVYFDSKTAWASKDSHAVFYGWILLRIFKEYPLIAHSFIIALKKHFQV